MPVAKTERGRWPVPRRVLKLGVLGGVVLLLLIQLVPYGHAHSNPPVTRAAQWPPGRGHQIAEAGCYDCHSNFTDWRWYSNVAPFSWLVQHDVEDGRAALDFSEWDRPQPDLGELTGAISSGEMPPLQYTLIHRSAKLSDAEKKKLVAAITRLYATDPPPPGGG